MAAASAITQFKEAVAAPSYNTGIQNNIKQVI